MFLSVYNFTCPSFMYSSNSSLASSQKSMLPTYTWWRWSSDMISIFFISSYFSECVCNYHQRIIFFVVCKVICDISQVINNIYITKLLLASFKKFYKC